MASAATDGSRTAARECLVELGGHIDLGHPGGDRRGQPRVGHPRRAVQDQRHAHRRAASGRSARCRGTASRVSIACELPTATARASTPVVADSSGPRRRDRSGGGASARRPSRRSRRARPRPKIPARDTTGSAPAVGADVLVVGQVPTRRTSPIRSPRPPASGDQFGTRWRGPGAAPPAPRPSPRHGGAGPGQRAERAGGSAAQFWLT